jgi:hypothetical protein
VGSYKSDDIERLRREEEIRGRRTPSDSEKQKQERQRRKQCEDILKAMTWREITSRLSLQPGTKEYESLYQIWRDYQRDRAEAEKKLRRREP